MKSIDDITNFIFMEDKLEEADIIFLPGVALPQTVEKAYELWKSGMAKYIMPSGKYSCKLGSFPNEKITATTDGMIFETECEYFCYLLSKYNVPSESILCEDLSTNTYENALFSCNKLSELGITIKKAIVCCQSYHARRVLMTYQWVFPSVEIMVCPVDTKGISKNNWYKNSFGIEKVLGELRRCGEYFDKMIEECSEMHVKDEIYDILSKRTSKRIRIYKHLDHIDGQASYPITLEIHPTNKCNLKCRFCLYTDERKSCIDSEVFDKLIDEIVLSEVKGVVFSGGGEPTLHPFLPKAVKKLYSKGIDVGLITNGYQITTEMLDVISMCKWVRISLNAENADRYNDITGLSADVYKRILFNISEIIRHKGQDTVIGISILLNNDSDIKTFFQSIDTAYELNVDQVFFKPLMDGFDQSQDIEELSNCVCQVLEYSKERKIVTNIKKLFVRTSKETCFKNSGDLCKVLSYNLFGLISADGNIFPCISQLFNTSYILGNIKSMTLKEAFSSGNLMTYNEIIKSSNCRMCKYKNVMSEIEHYKKSGISKSVDDPHYNFI